MFEIGDKVVYPHHGAGTVVKREKREVLGEVREYLTIQILHNDMTVNVPCENADRVGLRQVIDQRTVTMVVRTLSGGSTEMPKNWNRRFKHNRDKMKTGNIFELAEVVRNLAVREQREGPLDRREADVREGEEDPRLRAHVREGHGRGRGRCLARRRPLTRRAAEAQGEDEAEAGARERLVAPQHAGVRSLALPPLGQHERPDPAGGTWALLLAAGTGERLGIDRPKAFAALGGRPLLAESLDRLDRCPWVDAIVVAAPAGWEEPTILLAEELAARKVVSCVTGGASRAESAREALAEVDEDAVVVLVHDAARPLLSDDVVERVLGPLAEGYDGAVPALTVPDTLKRVDDGAVAETVSREGLVGAQTPQAFLAESLRRAYSGEVSAATDCASLVERDGGRVAVVEGDGRLLKVTTSEDLELVGLLLGAATS